MNIYAQPGHKVVYKGANEDQVNYVGNCDPRELLTIGQVYTVDYVNVGHSSSKVYLEGFGQNYFNTTIFSDYEPVEIITSISMNIKDHIGGFVHFSCYSKGELWYKTDSGLEFPVPIEDTQDGIFLAKDRAMLFMRYIRKHLENIKAGREECQG